MSLDSPNVYTDEKTRGKKTLPSHDRKSGFLFDNNRVQDTLTQKHSCWTNLRGLLCELWILCCPVIEWHQNSLSFPVTDPGHHWGEIAELWQVDCWIDQIYSLFLRQHSPVTYNNGIYVGFNYHPSLVTAAPCFLLFRKTKGRVTRLLPHNHPWSLMLACYAYITCTVP